MAAAALLIVHGMAPLASWRNPAWEGLPYFGAAALAFAGALLLRPLYAAAERVSARRGGSPNIRWRTGLIFASIGWMLIFRLGARVYWGDASLVEELGLWVLGIAFFVFGVSGPHEIKAGWRSLRRSWRTHRREWLFVLGVTAAALLVRLPRLVSGLPVIFGDEAPFGADAVHILQGARFSIFAPGHQGHPWLFPVMQAPFVAWLGRGLLPLRIVPLAAGTLTAPALYFMAREMFGRRAAMLAAVFLAGYPVHMHFSRIGINNIIDPLFGVLGLALLWRGRRKGGRLLFALAGVSLGLTQYFYSGGRLFLVLVWVYLVLITAETVIKRRAVRAQVTGAVILLGALAITIWPAFYYLYANRQPLIFRAPLTSVVASTKGQSIVENAIETGTLSEFLFYQVHDSFLGYIHIPDRFYFYAGETAMLLPAAAVPFLLGVMWALWRLRGGRRLFAHQAEAMLLAWVALTTLLGGVAMRKTPGYARFLVAVPALAVLVALGLALTLDFCARRLLCRRAWRRAVNAGMAAVIVALASGGVHYYYAEHLDALTEMNKPETWVTRDLRERIARLPREAEVHILAKMNLHAKAVLFYFGGDRTITYHEETPLDWGFVDRLQTGQYYAFFAPPDAQSIVTRLPQALPGGKFTTPPYTLPDGVGFVGYEVMALFWEDE